MTFLTFFWVVAHVLSNSDPDHLPDRFPIAWSSWSDRQWEPAFTRLVPDRVRSCMVE